MKLPYLTKQCDNEAFYSKYRAKIEALEEQISYLSSEIEGFKATYKNIDADIVNSRGDSTKTLPLFKKKRDTKAKVKLLEEKLIISESQLRKILKNNDSMRSWEVMFKSLNIDVSQRKQREEDSIKELLLDTQLPKIVNIADLKNIKRGMNLLIPSSTMDLNFKLGDQKYDLRAIFRLGKDYKMASEYRLLAAQDKVRIKLKEDTKRINNITKLRQLGSIAIMNTSRSYNQNLHSSLISEKELLSEDNSKDF